jgi:sugar/nucleoside kinase (ribokinase family)
MTARYDVIALGNAIMDVIAHVDGDFLARHGIARSAMTLIDEARCQELYAALPAGKIETSGGSAGNTIAGLCSLGARAAFMGKVGDDRIGAAYGEDMKTIGAGYYGAVLKNGPSTARSMIAVTADGERSMNTYLGASTDFAPEDVDTAAVAASEWLYLEGYLFDKEPAKAAFVRACEAAQAAGRKVSITLSDSFCVDRHRASFLHLIRTHVDLVFANEHELLSLYLTDNFADAVAAIRADSQMAAITRSEKGSVVVTADREFAEAAAPVAQVIDATGAGDQYAAGFLYGLTHGAPLPACAQLGHVCAAEVISHVGPRPAVSLRDLAQRHGLLPA